MGPPGPLNLKTMGPGARLWATGPRARSNSNTAHAGDFLDANPSPSLGLHMDSRSFGVAMGYRLGITLLKPGECRALNCNQDSDAKGDHAMHCHDDNGLKGSRHDRIRDNVFKEAQHASLNPTKEMPGLILHSQSRPADIYVANWIDGRKMAFDVSVVSPTRRHITSRRRFCRSRNRDAIGFKEPDSLRQLPRSGHRLSASSR